MSKENAPCIGPVSLKDAYEVCPLSMKLSLDTALLKPELRTRQSDSLFYCLKLSPRCFHCETVRIAKKSGKSNFIRDLLTITTAKPRIVDAQRGKMLAYIVKCITTLFRTFAVGKMNGKQAQLCPYGLSKS